MRARYLRHFYNVECLKNCSLEDGNTSRFRNVVLLFRDFRIKFRSHVVLNAVYYLHNTKYVVLPNQYQNFDKKNVKG